MQVSHNKSLEVWVCERGCGFNGVFSVVEAHELDCRHVRIDRKIEAAALTSAAAAVLTRHLFHATRDGDTVTVTTLLSTAGAQSVINCQDKRGDTPLCIAAHNGHASVTVLLMDARCNIDHQNKNGATPLFIAALYGHVAVTCS
jgi:hypothetical protein